MYFEKHVLAVNDKGRTADLITFIDKKPSADILVLLMKMIGKSPDVIVRSVILHGLR